MPSYRPSMIFNSKIRFDESLTVEPAPDPQSIDDLVETPAKNAGTPSPEPLVLRTGEANTSFVTARIPKTASVELPGYRQARKFNAKFLFKDLPLDPRTVRAASCEIHLGTVPADRFAKGYRLGNDPEQPLESVLQPIPPGGAVPNSETLLMAGTIDEWEVDHNSDGSMVTIQGRDLRGILLDTPINAGTKGIGTQLLDDLDTEQSIDKVVAQILAFNPFFNDFTVIANPNEWADGILPAPNSEDLIPRHRKGAKGNKAGGKPSAAQGTNGADGIKFWDLIVKVCYLVGAIPYMEGLNIVIRPSRSIYDKLNKDVDPVRNPTPFLGGAERSLDAQSNEPINAPLRIRRLVYGRDLEGLTLQRKFGGWRRPKHVRAVSFDPSGTDLGTGKVVVGIWPDPETNKQTTRVSSGNTKAMAETIDVPVPDVRDAVRLQEIARAIYEEIGRGEMGGVCETRNLSSFGGDNADPDLLRLRPGAGVEALVDTRRLREVNPLISEYTNFERTSFEDQVASIKRRIGDENLARAIVATARGQINELQRFFRVQNVKFTWNVDSGVKVSFDFENYVEVRAQVERPDVPDGEPTLTASATDQPVQPTTKNKSLRTAGGGT